MLDQCIEGLFGTFKLLKSSYKYSYSNIGWLWNKIWNKDLISTIFWFLSPTSLFTYAKIDFEPFTYNLYFFHVCTIFCSVFLPFFDPSIKHTPLGNVMALMFGQCISFITMIFSFLSIKEHTLHFIKLINRSWNTMPSAHGILATHLVQNFLVLSHDFFVIYPWVDFFLLTRWVKLKIKQIDNRRIWLMVLKILQPNSSMKKKKNRRIKSNSRRRNNGIRHTNRSRRRNGIKNQ